MDVSYINQRMPLPFCWLRRGENYQKCQRVFIMRRKANFIVLGTVVLTGLVLAACSSTSQPVDRDDPSADVASQQQEADAGAPVGNVEVSEGEDAASAPVLPDSAPAEVRPTPRPELSATDPSTVNLASGKPVLLEFFAFW
jgi:hypothetical protein